MNIYVLYDSPLELNLIRKYIGEIKDFIAANENRLVSSMGTVVEATWIPGVNFKAYRYRLTYRIDKLVYPRIPWNGRIAYISPHFGRYERVVLFEEPERNIIAGFFIRRADHENIRECERYTE